MNSCQKVNDSGLPCVSGFEYDSSLPCLMGFQDDSGLPCVIGFEDDFASNYSDFRPQYQPVLLRFQAGCIMLNYGDK